ncbi:MAG TPA: TetR/AcrR family transcriptional regulator [Spirochaetia bacterium]|nr:TetR/AcrR family transcriptional regulator [Spirochaetia bacterium]
MKEEQEIKDRILAKARELFFRSGFRRITMEEIAHELGISKKTLYLYFNSKQDLLRLCLEQRLQEMKYQVEQITEDNNRDSIKKMQGIFQAAFDLVTSISRNFLEDLRRYEPGLWKRIDDFRERVMFKTISRLLMEGRKMGMVRSDLDHNLIVLILFTTIQNIINPEQLARLPFSLSDVFETLLKIVYNGIFTERARTRFRSDSSSPEAGFLFSQSEGEHAP